MLRIIRDQYGRPLDRAPVFPLRVVIASASSDYRSFLLDGESWSVQDADNGVLFDDGSSAAEYDSVCSLDTARALVDLLNAEHALKTKDVNVDIYRCLQLAMSARRALFD